MITMRKNNWFGFVLHGLLTGLIGSALLSAQPVGSVMLRTILVERSMQDGRIARGSAFVLKVDGRAYVITAKHVITGLLPNGSPNLRALTADDNSVEIRVFLPHSPRSGGPTTTTPVRVKFRTLDTSANVDIIILVPPADLGDLDAGAALSPASDQIVYGQDCYFLGFPFGEENVGGFAGSDGTIIPIEVPLVRKCIISAYLPPPAMIVILDGFNNVGFSGGPVIVKSSSGLFDSVRAVISGFRPEFAQVRSGEAAVSGLVASVNSGFVYAYDVKHAVEAIRRANAVSPKGAH